MNTLTLDRSALLSLEQQTGCRRHFALESFELREASPTELEFAGYACVTERGYEMYGGPPYGWTETVARGAFTKTLAERCDTQLLVNHEGEPLARTKSGTLELAEDNTGLRVRAMLDRSDPDVQRLEPKMRRGDLDEMSFAFRTMRQEWNEDYTERRLVELSLDKGDVSIVNYGANDATSATLRAFERLRSGHKLADEERALVRQWVDVVLEIDTNDPPAAPPADPSARSDDDPADTATPTIDPAVVRAYALRGRAMPATV